MKGLVFLFVLVFSLFSCNKVCDYAKQSSAVMSKILALRWSCNVDKVSEFLEKDLLSKVCKGDSKSVVGVVCPMVADYLVKLGADAIAKKFDCNVEKVKNDLGNANRLCDLFNLLNNEYKDKDVY